MKLSNHSPKSWGRKDRQNEQRNLRARDQRAAIAESISIAREIKGGN